MEIRDEVAEMLDSVQGRVEAEGQASVEAELLGTVLRYCNLLDHELQKIRKELRTRDNGSQYE